MATLAAFLNPELPEEQEIKVSDRFKEDGEVVLFKIRPITQEMSDAIRKTCTRRDPKGERHFDSERFMRSIIVEGTVFPDFKAKELCDAYKTLDPLSIPPKMLLAGEYQRLANAIMDLSGLGDEAEDAEVEEAKNF